MDRASPAWCVETCEARIARLRAKALGFLGGGRVVALTSVALGVALVTTRRAVLALFAGDPFFAAIWSYFVPTAAPVLLLPVALFAADRRRLEALIPWLAALGVAGIVAGAPGVRAGPILYMLAVQLAVSLLGFALALAVPKPARLAVLLLASVAACALMGFTEVPLHPDWDFGRYLFPALPALSLAYFLAERDAGLLAFPLGSRSFFAAVLSPTSYSYFFPAGSGRYRARARDPALTLLALENFVVGFALIAASQLFRVPWPTDWTRGLVAYAYNFFGTSGLLRCFVALGQAVGFPLEAPFFFPLLAANPLEYWSRWNTYIYRWFRTFVFLPIVRRTGSLALAMGAICLVNSFLHTNHFLFAAVAGRGGSVLPHFLWDRIRFFLWQAIVIYLGFRVPGLWPNGAKRAGWWGVLLTNALMALAYGL